MYVPLLVIYVNMFTYRHVIALNDANQFLNGIMMYIYSSVCLVFKVLDFFFFSSLNLKFYCFCYSLEGYKIPWGETAKENITPCKM